MSFPINEPNGLTYSILSLTSDNQKRGTKAGVYVETNITPPGADVWQRYAAPMMLKLTVLFSQRAATSADVDPVPVTFDADLTGMGGEIDFGNTVEFIPLAYTGNQGLVIKVVPADPARGRGCLCTDGGTQTDPGGGMRYANHSALAQPSGCPPGDWMKVPI